MPIPVLSFWIFAALILGSALMVVTRRSAIAAALFLALSLVSVAGLFVTLHAEFLFAVQILVYTGGVMVLFLFVIMLVNVDRLAELRPSIRRWGIPVVFVAFSFGALAFYASRASHDHVRPWEMASNTRAIGAVLFTDYLLPFEVVSILLLVAMVGAIVLAKKEI